MVVITLIYCCGFRQQSKLSLVLHLMSKKAVVIGAGIGGMASAIRLAHLGFEISVYESNAEPGEKSIQSILAHIDSIWDHQFYRATFSG